jgi:hypothetical protein
MLHNVEDPQQLNNEPLYLETLEPDLGTYVVMDENDEPRCHLNLLLRVYQMVYGLCTLMVHDLILELV